MTARLDAAVAELIAAIIEITAEAERPASDVERLLDVPAACRAMNLGRTAVYAEIAAGRLRSIKVGRRRLVPASAIAEYASRQA